MLKSFLKQFRYDDNGTSKYGKDINPVTCQDVATLYDKPRSFTDFLPYMDYESDSKTFVLEDGYSVAAMFEITQVGVEACPDPILTTLRDNLENVLKAIPENPHSPWVVQFYVNDEPSLEYFLEDVEGYIKPSIKNSEYTQSYMSVMKRHLNSISKEGGLFDDTVITGTEWRGQIRKVRAIIYHRISTISKRRMRCTPQEEINDVASKFVNTLQACGVKVRRCSGKDLYQWMIQWFNPKPQMTDGDSKKLVETAQYPGDDNLPFGADLSESMIFRRPESDQESGAWFFDGMPHMCLTVQGLRNIPKIGHFSCERQMGEKICTLLDHFPENSTLSISVTISTQDEVKDHLERIRKASVGDSAEAEVTKDEVALSLREIEKGNSLYKTNICAYVRADNLKEMRAQNNKLNSIMLANSLQVIDEYEDELTLDSYIRNLPMNYDPAADKKRYRSRFMFSKHVASLMPVYGRSRGTGNPGMVFFNRGAEPVTCDPLNRLDRKKNGHMLMLGPSGAGKSAQLIYMLLHVIAIYKPRLYIIEAGNSFNLMGQYCKSQGLSVTQGTFSPSSDLSVPPFADAIKLLDANVDIEDISEDNNDSSVINDDQEDARDILGEMEIAARIMITGGEEKEDARMTRTDRLTIRHAIINAANDVKTDNRDQVMVEDVVKAMRNLAAKEEGRRAERAQELADGLELFCEGLANQFFNKPGKSWPETDVTIMEMGVLAREGYEDQLTVAYIGLMSKINNVVEKYQYDDRPTIVVTDEGHIITTNPLLSPYVVKITKMWRKLGGWYWIATQNLQDFPDQAARMLNMMEWWLCLVMPKEEVDQVSRFRSLTDEQKALLQAARKEPGKYTEGVILSDNLAALFRSVPPSLALSLAMSEKEEKSERANIMKTHNCSELEAAMHVAERIDLKRGIS